MSNFGGDAITPQEMRELERETGTPIGSMGRGNVTRELGQGPGVIGKDCPTPGTVSPTLTFGMGLVIGILGGVVLAPIIKRIIK